MYGLTPSRKPIAKSLVTRNSGYGFARHCLRIPRYQKAFTRVLGQRMRMEVKRLCSQKKPLSSFHDHGIAKFSWDSMINDLKSQAPILCSLLSDISKSKHATKIRSQKAVICICAGVLCKHRNASVNYIQKIISLCSYCGHASKKVSIHACLFM